MPGNDLFNEHDKNSNSTTAMSSKKCGTVRVDVATLSHTEHCDEAGNLDALKQSAKHHAESVPSKAASSSRDKATTSSGKKPIPGGALKSDAVSSEDDRVRTSLKHIGLIIEVCAGSAMLSRCFSECGFDVMPIDHSQNRFHPLAKICNLSLTEQASWDYLFWLVSTFLVAFCHFAPPCGTSSRARELDNGPPPLRNEAFPWGFPDLPTRDKARVDSANFIYRNMSFRKAYCFRWKTLLTVSSGKSQSGRLFSNMLSSLCLMHAAMVGRGKRPSVS